jgi:hypothetical protein
MKISATTAMATKSNGPSMVAILGEASLTKKPGALRLQASFAVTLFLQAELHAGQRADRCCG